MTLLDFFDSVARRIESFLSGGPVSDPLYLSNRTLRQKVRFGLLVATPVLALAGLVIVGLNSLHPGRQGVPIPKASAGEIAPKLSASPIPDSNTQDVDILEAGVTRGKSRVLSGRIRNKTDRRLGVVDLIFTVTNETHSQIGAVAVKIENVAPKAIARFSVELEQPGASSVIVRELYSR